MTFFASAAPAISSVNHKISGISDAATDIPRGHVGTSLRLHVPRDLLIGFVKRKTSNASPTVTEILGLIAEPRVKDSCKQTNLHGSM